VDDALVVQQPQTVEQRSSQPLHSQHHETLITVPLNDLVQVPTGQNQTKSNQIKSINLSIYFVENTKHWTGHQGRMQTPLTGAHKNNVSKSNKRQYLRENIKI